MLTDGKTVENKGKLILIELNTQLLNESYLGSIHKLRHTLRGVEGLDEV